MCWELTRQANEVEVGNSTQRALLDFVARTANDKTGLTWYSQETIGEPINIGCSRETIRRTTHALEERGDISCYRILGLTTVILVHPGDAIGQFKRKRLTWKAIKSHLKKSHFSKKHKVDIATWLHGIGWLSEKEANEALWEYVTVGAIQSKNTKGNSQASTANDLLDPFPQTVGRDPTICGAGSPKSCAEYENNKNNNKNNPAAEIDETQLSDVEGERRQALQSKDCPPAGRIASDQPECVKHILAGVNRGLAIQDLI